MITKDMLITGWRDCWKWWSVRLSAAIMAAPELYEQVPTMHEYISPQLLHHIMSLLALLVIASRITNQTKGTS